MSLLDSEIKVNWTCSLHGEEKYIQKFQSGRLENRRILEDNIQYDLGEIHRESVTCNKMIPARVHWRDMV
jgi:hypothetical protein